MTTHNGGLVVRPGDVLVLPIAPPSRLTTDQRDQLRQLAEAEFPGVRVLVVEGIAGGPFVYRPDPPPAPEQAVDVSWVTTDA